MKNIQTRMLVNRQVEIYLKGAFQKQVTLNISDDDKKKNKNGCDCSLDKLQGEFRDLRKN